MDADRGIKWRADSHGDVVISLPVFLVLRVSAEARPHFVGRRDVRHGSPDLALKQLRQATPLVGDREFAQSLMCARRGAALTGSINIRRLFVPFRSLTVVNAIRSILCR